ncbi:MAG: DUF3383 domain-containing protein [Clostridia bacterium]|nr:DUF3383 domain-containing protein [Clostridia bacterium]
MPISQSKYVAITSGIGGASAASRKDLGLRLFTTNALFPLNTVLEFTSASDVANYAGSSSQEAQIAAAYFGWVSKSINSPRKISFMGANLNATAPVLRSTQTLAALETFTAITNGTIVLSMGGSSYTLSNLNFSSATSYADIAETVEAGINGNTAGGDLWTDATVTFNAETSSFILTGGATGDNVITYATSSGAGTDISATIGWSEATNPILSNGTAATSLTDILNTAIELSDNFGSYSFLGITLTANQINTIGTWNDNQNYLYMYCGDVTGSNYSTIIAAAAAHQGMAINYQPLTDVLPAFLMPATILAATDYSHINGTVNYMYQQFPNQAVTVDTNALSNTLDNLNINYNGQTQKAGQKIEFYQNGYLADGTDIAVYANEIWLKDAMITELLNLEIALEKIPANIDGLAQIEATLQSVIDEGLKNGVVMPGKELTNTQKAYITQITGDNTAWQSVQLNGYVLTVELSQQIVNGATKYIAEYTLVYSKGDSIRKVEGRHILI